MKRSTITHVEFAKLATALSATKEAVEKELTTSTLTEMAAKRGIPKTTFRSLLETIGVDVRACLFPAKAAKVNQSADASGVIQDILKQLADICTQLSIQPTHIKQYLN